MFKNLFKKKRKPIKSTRKYYNMWEHNSWGDRISWLDYDKKKIHGHYQNGLEFLEVEDIVRDKMQSGNICEFIIIEIKQMYDPRDQFFATVKGIRYVDSKFKEIQKIN